MASSESYVEYILDEISGAGGITCKKMFGEYGLHREGKFFACIADNKLFIKETDAGKKMLGDNIKEGHVYPGSSLYFEFEEIENREFMVDFIKATCEALPAPKPKKPKTKK